MTGSKRSCGSVLYALSALAFLGLHLNKLRTAVLIALLFAFVLFRMCRVKAFPRALCGEPLHRLVPACLITLCYLLYRVNCLMTLVAGSNHLPVFAEKLGIPYAVIQKGFLVGGAVLAILGVWFGARMLLNLCDAFAARRSSAQETWKLIRKPFAALCGLNVLGVLAILRANYRYEDDLGRVFDGGEKWSNFSRYLNDFLSTLLHGNVHLNDLSPLPQLLACVIMAAAACVLILVMREQGSGVTVWQVAAVLPLSLSPWFLECFSYKMDAPYMALSVLVCLLPLLAEDWGDIPYGIAAFAGNLLMCMSYQASSGIFPVTVLFLFALRLTRGVSFRDALRFVLISAGAWACALVVYRIFIMMPYDTTYVSTGMLPLKSLVSGTFVNLACYWRLAAADLPLLWLAVCGLLAVCVPVTAALSGKHPVRDALLLCGALLLGCCLCFGTYPLLSEPLFAPRGMYGIGLLLALCGLYLASRSKAYVGKAVALCLAWLMLGFGFLYGNTLSRQEQWTELRLTAAMTDLSRTEGFSAENAPTVSLTGDIGLAPSVKADVASYPVLERLLRPSLGGSTHWARYRARYAGLESLGVTLNLSADGAEHAGELPVLTESLYHTISGDGTNYLITFH